jgi:hypothetical protein
MSGMFSKPDTSAQEKMIKEQRAENERIKREAEAEKSQLAAEEASRKRARSRGGSRMLLSEARVSPEAGVQTLGSTLTEG